MCGIVGIVNLEAGCSPDRSAIERAADVLRHRGPDDGGIYTDGQACLGFRRLSIIDLETGTQPMCNEDGTIWVTYNGEIYNFPELAAALKSKGHAFKSRCDTEVILHQYEEQGDACVSAFNGMFAFALWDTRRRRLLLARDRLGIKPLYYALTAEGIVFASELKALLCLPGVDRGLSQESLCNYLTFRYVPGPETIFEGIRKLPPGHLISMEDGVLSEPQEYWDIAFSPETHAGRPEDELVEEFSDLLGRAVTSHLVSDVPLGVLLSGGLDSTAMVACMREQGVEDLRTFSVAFETGGQYDERAYAREAATAFGTDHHEVVLSARDFQDLLADFIWHSDEPLADLASVPLFAVARLAREHVTVVLSGEGSDELFGGYPGIEAILRRGRMMKHLHRIPSGLRRLAARALEGLVPSHGAAKWGQALGGSIEDFSRALKLNMTNVFSTSEKLGLVDGIPNETCRAADALLDETYGRRTIPDPLNQILYMYIKLWLPDDLLAKADRMTMANSLELRVPFLDNDLVQFTAELPVSLKVRPGGLLGNWDRKHILRRALHNRVPESILRREKLGFPVPAYEWLATDLRDFAWDHLLERSNPALEWFRRSAVEELLRSSVAGNEKCRRQVWVLLVLALWHERYLG